MSNNYRDATKRTFVSTPRLKFDSLMIERVHIGRYICDDEWCAIYRTDEKMDEADLRHKQQQQQQVSHRQLERTGSDSIRKRGTRYLSGPN